MWIQCRPGTTPYRSCVRATREGDLYCIPLFGSSNTRPLEQEKSGLLRFVGLRIADLQRPSRSRLTNTSAPNLRSSAVRTTLGRTVVQQLTAQELLPHNLQPDFACQSLTGGWLDAALLHRLRQPAPLALLPVDCTGVNGSGVKHSNRSDVAEQY